MDINENNLKLLKKGVNSEVYEFKTKSTIVVLKIVPCKTKQARHLEQEFNVLSDLNHENIVKVMGYRQKLRMKSPCCLNKVYCKDVLVMQYAQYGSLLDWKFRVQLAQPEIRWVMAEIAQGVHYLHSNYIVHRDLKLDNILVSRSYQKITIKIADFGFAAQLTESSQLSHQFKGTRKAYMSPQIHNLLKDSSASYCPIKADIFSLGVIFFTLMFNKLPFEYAVVHNTLYNYIASEEYTHFWNYHQNLTKQFKEEKEKIQQFKNLFISMVHYDPQQRPTILQILNSEWMKGKQSIITL